jgi:ectoine hydroxylase-related dioxygenase (phytanoyl-CoA dioxygenase family)
MIDAALYKENGYLLVKALFARNEVERIRAEAKQVFIAQMLRLGIAAKRDLPEDAFEQGMYKLFQADTLAFVNAGKQVQHLVSLHRLSLDERVIAALKQLGLEFPNISTRPLLYFNSRRLAAKEVYWRLSLHQDWRSMQGSLDAVVVWVGLTDIKTPLGALEIVPRSHKWGLLDSDMIDGYGHIKKVGVENARPVPVEVEAGDALFFSALLVHQSGTNVTDSIRWSCHFRYNNLQEKTFVERGFPHPYLYRPQEDLITADFPTRAQVRALFEGGSS